MVLKIGISAISSARWVIQQNTGTDLDLLNAIKTVAGPMPPASANSLNQGAAVFVSDANGNGAAPAVPPTGLKSTGVRSAA
ncbi:hypothetical protein KCP75_13615 [Salmonella enterica subsp. enterica]|nr:hypothetical protein KCP75_13615 [Salmonella enterica subsp. enterica]